MVENKENGSKSQLGFFWIRSLSIDVEDEIRGRSGVTLEFLDELTLKSSNKGAGVIPYVLDEPSDYYNSSSSNLEFTVEDILSNKADVTEKDDESKKTNDEKAEEEHVRNQRGNEKAGDAQAKFLNNNPDVNVNEVLKDPVEPEVQSMVDIHVQQVKLAEQRPPRIDTAITLSPNPTTVSPTQPPPTQQKRRKLKRILKKSKRPESQVDVGELDNKVTRLEKKFHAMSSFNLPDPIDKSVKSSHKKVAINDEEPVVDEVVNDGEHPHDDDTPSQDRSKWFKQSPRPETFDPNWHKEPNADDMLMMDQNRCGSIVDFTKFTMNRLKKDIITNADLEGPTFMLLKGTCGNQIELEYNFEQCHLALSDKLDWTNPERDRCPFDMSKPLPLQGPLGKTMVQVSIHLSLLIILPFYLCSHRAGDSRAEYASSDEATTYIYVGLVVRLEMSVRLLRDDRQETTMALIVKGCCGDSRVSSEGDRKDRAAMRAEIEVLRRERLAYEQESMETRQALARSEAHCRALEARVTVLETEVHRHEWQRQAADDLAI
ncbi:hypothetical protein Tco_0595918 [Tanacetum coccineum]